MLDNLVVDFVDRSESYLSQYGIGLNWAVVQQKAKEFAAELNSRGIMNDEDSSRFKASNGYNKMVVSRHFYSLVLQEVSVR